MGKRRKIGIVFAEDESWAGGFYYVLNIIKALGFLTDSEKPYLKIFLLSQKYKNQIEEIKYPYIEFLPLFVELPPIKKLINKISFRLFRKKVIYDFQYPRNIVDFAYPINYCAYFYSLNKVRKIFWIPDFQHLHLPQYFSKEALDFRNQKIQEIIDYGYELVLSSNDSKKDFLNFFNGGSTKIHVLNFPSILDTPTSQQIEETIQKFAIDKPYFLSCNQFWQHKNQILILEAILLLKKKGIEINVVFTGNMNDHCELEYVNNLLSFVSKHNLQENIKFLGYISRQEQISLILKSIAVIQPSLFEGWSTIVEDCKALNKFIIVSDLEVHKEQVKENCLFFNRTDSNDLSIKIEKSVEKNLTTSNKIYSDQIFQYANKIISI